MGGYSWTNTLKDLWRLNLKVLNKLMSDKFKVMGNWNSVNSMDQDLNLWEDLSNFTGNISPLQSHTIVAHKVCVFKIYFSNQILIFSNNFIFRIDFSYLVELSLTI